MKAKLIAAIFSGLYLTPGYAEIPSIDFDDWAVIRSSDGKDLLAVTANDAGHAIAFRCFASTKNCIHAINVDVICDDGDKYPVLINSDLAALSMDAVCSKNGDRHELLLTKYDDIHTILLKGNDIGFAIPMGSGLFKVSRFSLKGSDKAMNLVETTTANLKNSETYL